MGHKVSPLIFRSREFPEYKNLWIAETPRSTEYVENYKFKLHVCVNLKHSLSSYLKKTQIDLLGIKFQFTKTQLSLILILPQNNISKPYLEDSSLEILNSYITKCSLWLTLIKKDLTKKYGYKFPKIFIKFCFLKQECLSADFLLFYIKGQLKRSISVRKVLKQTYLLLLTNTNKYKEDLNCQGIKIQVSGRINGISKARQEYLRQGTIPFQSIGYNIKYANSNLITPYGILGIKLWLFISN